VVREVRGSKTSIAAAATRAAGLTTNFTNHTNDRG